ncbi:MAG TPA: hypothetical protein DHV28_02890 [Ignavibacteriales bacterium]|nr:hypothetical protein [Ignavibacteriales bacterium]
MFENEIKFISDFILNKVKDMGSFITVEKFLSIDVHPAIKKYVEGEIDYLISEDRKKLIENSLFDYSGTEISNHFTLIGNEIKKTQKISFEDIKNIVLQAVSFNANYVVRPKWALSKLIFGNNKSVSVNELKQMLNYTYYYEYLNSVFLAYVSKKKILNISSTEFELIMNKIDRELFMLHQSKLVDNALFAIADYFSIGGLNKSSISVESVENFLKEKNLTELLFRLKRFYAGAVKKKVDIEELRKILYATLSIDSTLVEETNAGNNNADEKHFENPLKEDLETAVSYSENEKTADEEKLPEFNEMNEDSNLVIEPDITETETIDDKNDEEKSFEILENAINKSEPDKFELTEDIHDINDIVEKKEEVLEDDLSEVNRIPTENVLEEEYQKLDGDTEPQSPEQLNDEEILASLTDEIEKNKDDEIIILDEKEQEDLLNFYDNELEISIDDDLTPLNKKLNEDIIDDEGVEVDEPSLEPELTIDEKSEEEIPIEKIDFEKVFSKAEDSSKKEDEEIPVPIIRKRNEDIFSYLSKKEIDRIIKNLFNSDSEDFANTVEKIAKCNSYEDATVILENIFKYARIKPHNRDASAFTNAVSRYFNMEK